MIDMRSGLTDQPARPAPGMDAFRARESIAVLPQIAQTLAEHHAQIRALQQAIEDIANAAGGRRDAPSPGPDTDHASALGDRVTELESRLIEQDRMIRHTLTMLIEWIETPGLRPRER